MIRVLPAKDEEVYNTLKSFPEVKEIIQTYGEYDIIIKTELSTLEELDHFVFNKLRATDGVAVTTTLIEARPKFKRGG